MKNSRFGMDFSALEHKKRARVKLSFRTGSFGQIRAGRFQPFSALLAFWRRLVRTVFTCAAFAVMVSSVVLSMFSQ